jgi:hypothetical protein
MAWHITGRSMEFCSCAMLCPCWLGPEGKPDQGWCSGVLGYQVDRGDCEGVNLGGAKVVLTADWPGNFFAGDATARLYIDGAANTDQRRELEAIFTGKKGGLLEPLFDAVVAKWLPTQVTGIDIRWGDNPSVTVGSVGQAKLTPLKDQAGRPTKVAGAAARFRSRAWLWRAAKAVAGPTRICAAGRVIPARSTASTGGAEDLGCVDVTAG